MQCVRSFFRHRPRLALSLAGASLLSLGFAGGTAAQRLGVGEGWLLPQGQDLFESEMLMDLVIGENMDTVMLQGPTIIKRGNPEEPPGGGGGGGQTIPTEILEMDLRGTSEILGPVRVMLNPSSPSTGLITGLRDPDGDLLYPAVSFFDVFVEVNLPDQNLTLHGLEALHLQGQASDEHLPDDEHRGGGVHLVDESGGPQGRIGSVRFVPKPPLERKVSRVIVKKLNKVIRYVLRIPTVHPESEVLVASKSLTLVVPGHTERFVVGAANADVPTPDILVENPFKRDANVKICVDATRLLKGDRHVLLALDVAGDGDFRLHSIRTGAELLSMENTCFVVATREFYVAVKNKFKDSVPMELAIIWTTGQVIP